PINALQMTNRRMKTLVIAIAALTLVHALAAWIATATSRQLRSPRASTSVSPHKGKQSDAIKQGQRLRAGELLRPRNATACLILLSSLWSAPMSDVHAAG
ncbi:MAG: hypothetical protein WA322_03900, partial [Pseudolabrys sp.]